MQEGWLKKKNDRQSGAGGREGGREERKTIAPRAVVQILSFVDTIGDHFSTRPGPTVADGASPVNCVSNDPLFMYDSANG